MSNHCQKCNVLNRSDSAFCIECGTVLGVICPSCNTANSPTAKFCHQCGIKIVVGSNSQQTPEELSHTNDNNLPEAERRQLTVMFCDLVGSTPLSHQLDPEELRNLIGAYQHSCYQVIATYDGYIARYVGDGLLVYFGFPYAHENDAERAIRAALDIVNEMGPLSKKVLNKRKIEALQVRIGIHTGVVVAGKMNYSVNSERIEAIGSTPNLAARLQGIAEPNNIVISDSTLRLVKGRFIVENLGQKSLKGFDDPMNVFLVKRESGLTTRLDIARVDGITPFVGRKEQIKFLLEHWKSVKSNEGSAVIISGEAGLGKSRLIEEIKSQISTETFSFLECHCSPFYQNSALYPLINLLQHLLGFSLADSSEQKLDKLETFVSNYAFSFSETIPLLAELLSITIPESYSSLELTPQRRKKLTLECVIKLLNKIAAVQPTILVIEDLHWVDPSTMELFSLFVEQRFSKNIFLILTARPEFILPSNLVSKVSLITLNQLSLKETKIMVHKVAQGKKLPTDLFHEVIKRTDGIPLFVEELTKMVLESDILSKVEDHYVLTESALPLSIPSTLKDSLMARLDKLSAVKEVAQLGAILGREFSYDLLQAVSILPEKVLQNGLEQLVKSNIIYPVSSALQQRYIFKHALIQESAYQSLLKSKRQQLHQKTAEILEQQFPQTAKTQPELLAHHYTQAGIIDQAIIFWTHAGENALARSANQEAIGHFNQGLLLTIDLPNSFEQTKGKIKLMTLLGAPLIVTKGWADPEVIENYIAARNLCEEIGESLLLFPVLWGLWLCHNGQAKWQKARQIGQQLLTLANQLQDPACLLQAHHALGPSLVMLGEFETAQEHLEKAIALYDIEQHRSHAFKFGGHDPCVCCLHLANWTTLLLANSDQEHLRNRDAQELTKSLSHPPTNAHNCIFSAIYHQLRWEPQTTQKLAEAALIIAEQQGLAQYQTHGTILLGWAHAEQGRFEEGITLMNQGFISFRATGAGLFQLYFRVLMADAYLKGGLLIEAKSVLEEAIVVINEGEERFYASEVYRMMGELLHTISSNQDTEAEALFNKSIQIARQQKARLLELRAVTSLCTFWNKKHKRKAARHLLMEIYSSFKEETEIVDMLKAKELLKKLN